MTSPDPDAYWRRPAEEGPTDRPADGSAGGPAGARPAGSGDKPEPSYPGPPPSAPPPPGWRTPVMVEPHAPRELPAQDHAALDGAERQALIFTYGVGILAGAVVLVLLFVVCARLVS